MKVFVCVKNVPDTAANIRVVGENSFDESIKFLINPYDEYAIEEAARLVEKKGGGVVKGHGSKVTIYHYGITRTKIIDF